MVGEMRLAGELGSLLQIEKSISQAVSRARQDYQSYRDARKDFLPGLAPARARQREQDLDFSGVSDARFFTDADDLIIAALTDFAASAQGAAGIRRQLFADDSAQGIAIIELMRKKYDAVLMNPPFGAGSTKAKKEFEAAFPRTKNDVYAAFVERGIQLLHRRALLGAITSRTGFFLSSFQKWREEILLKEAPPTVVADLGQGVMDAAMVEAAAYCLEVAG